MFTSPTQQKWIFDAAYRKGWAKGLAISDPSRMIAVSVSSHIVSARTPYAPRRISFSTRQDTPMKDVVSEIHHRLPKIEHPFSITTSGAHPQVLGWDTEGELMEFLQPWDVAFLELRLRIHDPALQEPPQETSGKKTLGSRLRKALGRSEECSRDLPGVQSAGPSSSIERPPSHSSVQSAPPPYEATAPSLPPIH